MTQREREVRRAFADALDLVAAFEHGGLVGLDQAGWEERNPDEVDGWSFIHPDFPDEIVYWLPSRGIWKVEFACTMCGHYHQEGQHTL